MEQVKDRHYLNKLLGQSPQMKQLYATIDKVANSDSTVLICGESGTGKELVAKAIHYCSNRSEKPFVPVNCGAIPNELLESELFGHEKGAFTGAINTRKGRFELADCGTILLDEIGELHPTLQVKLLRIIQEREFERVGGTKTLKIDVRILAATNKNLEIATKNGDFREDLFYRLNVIPVFLPPLRERKDDLPVLTEHFMTGFCSKQGKEPLKITPEAVDLMMKHHWPGNVRELETLIERCVILDDTGVVRPEDLPERFRQHKPPQLTTTQSSLMELPMEGIDLNAILDDIENNLITQALQRAAGVKSKAAGMLGLNRTTFLEKLKKRRIEFKDKDLFGG
ncbi:sigma-54 dependent transcriptional regulator [Candidatus Magnetobacterium bavaricum]|uniref:Sigma-54 dependent transcriptional regulator n=1 Tax=Candidatus Magnetobacterium bavaricum TaxID=29290 RepID=A0A0F3H0H6_9BACT|nr:sigma-54 dependent transcriptional regulator [Candidatus Magnetobacterium bavaricum]